MNKYQAIVENLPTFPGEEGIVKARAEEARPEWELDKVEKAIKFALPDDYRNFLKFYGDLSLITGIEFPTDGVYPAYGGCEYFLELIPLLNPMML